MSDQLDMFIMSEVLRSLIVFVLLSHSYMSIKDNMQIGNKY